MITAILHRLLLAAAATVLVVAGAGSVFSPEVFYADYGIDVSTVELANELRASGMVLLVLGLMVAGGVARRRAQFPAAVIAALVLLSYAAGRGMSILLDGTPQMSVLVAGITEATVGAAAVWVAVQVRPGRSAASATDARTRDLVSPHES